jgi:hypothetical protein
VGRSSDCFVVVGRKDDGRGEGKSDEQTHRPNVGECKCLRGIVRVSLLGAGSIEDVPYRETIGMLKIVLKSPTRLKDQPITYGKIAWNVPEVYRKDRPRPDRAMQQRQMKLHLTPKVRPIVGEWGWVSSGVTRSDAETRSGEEMPSGLHHDHDSPHGCRFTNTPTASPAE